ncbi:YidH family protein [Candidatus Magnetomonas plexicatena]|uniref:YidH family protein n=1 Tax=Candidatus Magnetomonas plexicatena TaxID=2552947 RepID=UPI001104BB8A|nr:DUF202 domain-containing protein [Nitrospirales bacterium LBB_01]
MDRNFLSWVKTGISIIVFGIISEKFVIFVEGLDAFFSLTQKKSLSFARILITSSVTGSIMLVVGTAIIFLAGIRYKNVNKMIKQGQYTIPNYLTCFTAMAVLIISTVLIYNLYKSL